MNAEELIQRIIFDNDFVPSEPIMVVAELSSLQHKNTEKVGEDVINRCIDLANQGNTLVIVSSLRWKDVKAVFIDTLMSVLINRGLLPVLKQFFFLPHRGAVIYNLDPSKQQLDFVPQTYFDFREIFSDDISESDLPLMNGSNIKQVLDIVHEISEGECIEKYSSDKELQERMQEFWEYSFGKDNLMEPLSEKDTPSKLLLELTGKSAPAGDHIEKCYGDILADHVVILQFSFHLLGTQAQQLAKNVFIANRGKLILQKYVTYLNARFLQEGIPVLAALTPEMLIDLYPADVARQSLRQLTEICGREWKTVIGIFSNASLITDEMDISALLSHSLCVRSPHAQKIPVSLVNRTIVTDDIGVPALLPLLDKITEKRAKAVKVPLVRASR